MTKICFNYFIKFSFFLLLLFFSGCSLKQEIKEVSLPNQNIQNYSHNFNALPQTVTQNLYERHFRPWSQKRISTSKEDASWGLMYSKKQMYGVNYKKLDSFWFNEQISNANFEDFSKDNLKAITIKNSHLKIFPTLLPLFYNPLLKGEGFPFDYNQNSGIKINTPIIISHFSKDKAWAYAESSFASGFIPTSSLAIVDENIINTFKKSTFYVAVKDNFPIYKNGIFKESIKLGTIFPKSQQGNFFVVNAYHNQQGYLQTINAPKDALIEQSLPINEQNITLLINELINEPYGWGESFYKRDCSALTKDYFSTLGVFLSRNSGQQAKNGEYFSLKELNSEEKKEFIIKHGKPFFTLLYLKGHIMLYVGVSKENDPLAFHNIWSIKTKSSFGEEQRTIIGKAIISHLDVGKELENYQESSSILNRIESMAIIK
ncbi:MAG: SH3 domain-containing protein [Arcobacteraceae bacterium]